MKYILVFDVGSTFTKVTGFTLNEHTLELVSTAKAPTTVQDIKQGLTAAKEALGREFLPQQTLHYASSSAAGGLRMVALGFMPRVTVKAAKEVAMNAGARVLEVLASDLPQDAEDFALRVQVLSEIKPDIILLSGGTDGGDCESLVSHAQCVVKAIVPGWSPMTIVAGNRDAQGACAEILRAANLKFTQVPNILPTIHELRVAPARAAIHQEFIKQITKAKGLQYLQEMMENKTYKSDGFAENESQSQTIIPTPAAVLMGAELLAKGYHDTAGLGALMVIDLGGATTDIHSVIPELDDLAIEERGLIISNEKQVSFRTVEGNLGMRVSACGILETLNPLSVLNFAEISELKAAWLKDKDREFEIEAIALALQNYAEGLEKDPAQIVNYNELSLAGVFDQCLATAAIFVALRRHAGVLAAEPNSVLGIIPGMPSGRDVRLVSKILAVGGIFVHLSTQQSLSILHKALANPGLSLLPTTAEFIIDQDYLLYTLGVLSASQPQAALNFGLKHFIN